MKKINKLFMILPLSLCVAVTACSSKPPGCADTETIKTARGLLVKNIVEYTVKANNKQPDDPDGWLHKFYDGLKVEITGIVSDGYKEDARKQFCKGTLKITAITGDTAERSIEYSTQQTEDKEAGNFLMEIQDAQPFVQMMGGHALTYYRSNRMAGIWNGTYSCNGMKGATEGPQGPFSLPVSMVVEENKAKLERTTIGGGIEKLAGDFNFYNGLLRLEGIGENTPDDSWKTKFEGKVNGKNVVAEGAIRLPDGTELRQCRLELMMK